MKSILTVLGLAVVLCAAAFGGYLWAHRSTLDNDIGGILSPTPTPDNMIIIDVPVPGAQVTSPLKVTGRARGNWFFEASFPVTLTDWDGRILAQTQAQAKSDWMTTDWVPFEATIVFTPDVTVSSRGAITLKKDNPSGLPKNDDSREITVFFHK